MLTQEQADRFIQMFAQCRSSQEFEQVAQALNSFCCDIQVATDRHALIWQEDPLGLDEYEEGHFKS